MIRQLSVFRFTALLLIFVMAVSPVVASAQSFNIPTPTPADTARQAGSGQSYGESLVPSDIGSYDNGNLSFPGGSISISELFPDSQSEEGGSHNFPYSHSTTDLTAEANSDPGLNAVGGTSLSGMRSEVNRPGGPTSIQGMAYEVIHRAGEQSRPDFRNDPMLNPSRNTMDNIDLIVGGFADCSVGDNFAEGIIGAHVPDYQQCIRQNVPKGDCTITHHIEIDTEPTDIVFIIDRSASMDSEIAALRQGVSAFATLLSQGRSNNLRIGGAAMRENNHLSMNTPLSYDINQFQQWINSISTQGGPTSPWSVLGWAANHFDWRTDPDVHRVLVIIGNDDDWGGRSPHEGRLISNDIDLYVFHNRYNNAWHGTHVDDRFNNQTFMRLAQFFTVVYDYWAPESCIDDAVATLEEFCTGSYAQYPTNPRNCVDIDGFYVCPGDPIYHQLTTPPIPNVDRLAARVNVSPIECHYDQGTESCWTDQFGDEQCVSGGAVPADECKAFEDNPQCGFVSSTCVDYAEGSWGTCYVHEETWDCGETYDVPTLERSGEYECGGPIRCMGTECFSFEQQQSPDFARATAMLNAAQNMVSDMSCEQGAVGTACTVFSGEAQECKRAVSGTVDCCETPSGISLKDYLTMIMTVPKIDSAIMGIESTDALSGLKSSYELLREPVMDSWSTITSPFSSRVDAASGAWDGLKGTVQDAALEVVENLKKKAAELTNDLIFSAAEEVGLDAAGQAAAGEGAESFSQQLLGEAGASFLGTAMTAYQIYVATMIAIQLIWRCEESEFELNVKRELKSCRHIGTYCKTRVLGYCIERRQSYCCFNSPLSRILQQEIRKQVGPSWGSAESPSCDGIPVARLDQVDWDRVNLDEWLGILAKEGLYKGSADFDITSLTGYDSHLNTDDRLDAIDRTQLRFDDIDVDQFRLDARDEMRRSPMN